MARDMIDGVLNIVADYMRDVVLEDSREKDFILSEIIVRLLQPEDYDEDGEEAAERTAEKYLREALDSISQ